MKLRPDLPAGTEPTPTFVPDATYGAVRGVGGDELAGAGVRVVMVNAFHLLRTPGITRVSALGGAGPMMGWPGPVMTDSGGFQAYSLIRENSKNGSITKDGLTFRYDTGDKVKLTPERAIINQRRLGSDLMFCLDDCTHPDDQAEEQELSVERTIAWAKRCKAELARALGDSSDSDLDHRDRPRLFAVVQGGGDEQLRRRCAEALVEIGFDGYGFGGWPLDRDGNLLYEMFAVLRDAIPAEFPIHGLGLGHPVSIARCAPLGYATFDSALPTRDARRGRIYRFRPDAALDGPRQEGDDWFQTIYLRDDKHQRQTEPISPDCSCVACTTYSIGYLHHLLSRDEPLYVRLATLHNLTFMAELMRRLEPAVNTADR